MESQVLDCRCMRVTFSRASTCFICAFPAKRLWIFVTSFNYLRGGGGFVMVYTVSTADKLSAPAGIKTVFKVSALEKCSDSTMTKRMTNSNQSPHICAACKILGRGLPRLGWEFSALQFHGQNQNDVRLIATQYCEQKCKDNVNNMIYQWPRRNKGPVQK